MHTVDWIVLFGTLLFIVLYGAWKTRKANNIEGFLKGGNQMKWYTIGLSIMATQASAITFLSTPGQAYEDGMGFVQFYFGLPIAMVIISTVFIPIYYKLKVFTAYEYLEQRFDIRLRLLTAFLFLVSRGLAAGITIYAPAIILSTLLGWNLNLTNILIGVLVIIYTVSGGTRAVSLTQKWQMAVILVGMVIAFSLTISGLPDQVGFLTAVDIAGNLGKMNVIDLSVDPGNRYTLLSGLTGGLFLALSYFGTDQSQVQRYLGGVSVKESRFGLMFNGLLKIPMQFFILLAGVMVFVFFQFNQPPAFFNQPGLDKALETGQADQLRQLQEEHDAIFRLKRESLLLYADEPANEQALATAAQLQHEQDEVRAQMRQTIAAADKTIETKDSDYIFLTYIVNYLPIGIVGLLLAVIFSAAMSSTAGEINALASTTVVDYYKRLFKAEATERHYVLISKAFIVGWGIMAIIIALSARLFDNLIQLVNILGSLFYGTILGIFLVAFFLKRVHSRAVFIAGILAESAVLICHLGNIYDWWSLGYLLYNVIGCGLVFFLSMIFQMLLPVKK
jgi:SSS family solute:Na+ symporter